MAAFTVIDHTELGAAAASWTEGSIPSSYDHLCLKISARTDQVAVIAGMGMKFNSATTNYSETRLTASSATPASSRKTGESIFRAWGNACGANALADTFSTTTVWIPNYANTANYKPFMSQSAVENNSTTNDNWYLMLGAGLWSDTAAISQIDISLISGDDFVQYSTFTLYGVTGA
jgi:hypothetical protein